MTAQPLMVQGTASSVGKSLLVTALCRIFRQDGYRVAPFKSQNMALNSYITAEGLEMGRAQVVQAEACGLPPSVLMNPILLKPTTDRKAQIIVRGKVLGNMSAAEYHQFKPRLKEMVRETYQELAGNYDLIVLEGAGSPAEINLKEADLVNMGMAELADAPVILVGDIDKGGVFAAIVGTLALLNDEEKRRVKGVVINKFRGDPKILQPGIEMLEKLIHLPVLGVIPSLDIHIDDEDSVTEEFDQARSSGGKDADYQKSDTVRVEVIRLPHISNFTDFRILKNFPDVSLRYVKIGEHLHDPDLVILPGSKNTVEDLLALRACGLEREITKAGKAGRMVAGICGGYQMLGRLLSDPLHTESDQGEVSGMGLLDMTTIFAREKVTTQVIARVAGGDGITAGLVGEKLVGYEIHMGQSVFGEGTRPLIMIEERLSEKVCILDGVSNEHTNIWGTYIHGIFDNTAFTRRLLNNIRKQKGLAPIEEIPPSLREINDREYDRLAEQVRKSLDLVKVYAMMGVMNMRCF